MENAMIQNLNTIDVRDEKRKKQEDLKLIREMLQTYESMISNNILLTEEDKQAFQNAEQAETLLIDEISNIDKMLLEFIAVSKDTLKKSSDLMDTGRKVDLDFSGEKQVKAGKARDIKTRRNKMTIKLDIEVLIKLNTEIIKRDNVKSVRALFNVLYPDRNYQGGNNEARFLQEALTSFWGY